MTVMDRQQHQCVMCTCMSLCIQVPDLDNQGLVWVCEDVKTCNSNCERYRLSTPREEALATIAARIPIRTDNADTVTHEMRGEYLDTVAQRLLDGETAYIADPKWENSRNPEGITIVPTHDVPNCVFCGMSAGVEPLTLFNYDGTQAYRCADVLACHKRRERKPAITNNAGMFSSNKGQWYTPTYILDMARDVIGGEITLDPASDSEAQKTIRARYYFDGSQGRNGLQASWNDHAHGASLWLNPPYGREIAPWIDKWLATIMPKRYAPQALNQTVPEHAFLLIPARVDTKWFRPLWGLPMCFVHGRITFQGASSGAPFPSVIIYSGKATFDFENTFEKIGTVGCLRCPSDLGTYGDTSLLTP